MALPSLSLAATSAGAPLLSLSLAATSAGARLLYTRPPLPSSVLSPPTPLPIVSSTGAPVLNLDPSGSPLTFRSDCSLWPSPSAVASRQRHRIGEAGRDHSHPISRTLCLFPTHFNPIPKEKWSLFPPTYSPVLSDASPPALTVAFAAPPAVTVLNLPAPPAAHVASLPCVNLLLNSVVSTHAFFGSIDLTNFYLGTPLSHPNLSKSLPIFSPTLSSPTSTSYPSSKTGPPASGKPYLLFRIDQTMYGLKEAGKLS